MIFILIEEKGGRIVKQERHVLVVFPHPDDEAFSAAGTISAYVANGAPITYACLTLGEMGRNMGNPPFTNREALPLIRKKELREAASILGINDVRMLGFRDKTIEFEDEEKLTNTILSLINETKPSLVITFYPGYAVHPDHDACGEAVVRAMKAIPIEKRPTLHCVAFSHHCIAELGEPDIVYDISKFAHIKLAAIKAHRTQTELMIKLMEEKQTDGDSQVISRLQTETFWTFPF